MLLILIVFFLSNKSLFSDEIKFKKELVYEIIFSRDQNIGHDKNIIKPGRGYECPYNINADLEGNLWIVDPVKKRCLILDKNKTFKVFIEGKEFEEINNKYGFTILAVEPHKRIMLPSCIISVRSKKVLTRLKAPVKYFLIRLNAGFIEGNGAYVNGFQSRIIYNSKGKIILHSYFTHKWENGKIKIIRSENGISSIFYDYLRKKLFFIKDGAYLVDSYNKIKIPFKYAGDLLFIDRHGYIYTSKNTFRYPNNAEINYLYISDFDGILHNKIKFYRVLQGDKSRREDIIGFTPNGEIFYTDYRVGESVRIYRLIPIDIHVRIRKIFSMVFNISGQYIRYKTRKE